MIAHIEINDEDIRLGEGVTRQVVKNALKRTRKPYSVVVGTRYAIYTLVRRGEETVLILPSDLGKRIEQPTNIAVKVYI